MLSSHKSSESWVRILIASLVLCQTLVHASGTIDIHIVDSDGAHIRNATISIDRGNGTEEHIQNEKGITSLEVKDELTLLVTAYGYFSKEVSLTPENDDRLRIQLRKKPNLEEVVVRAQRISRKFAPTFIEHIESLMMPASRGDALISVNTLQYALSEGETAHLELRGSPDVSSRVYLDEVPIYGAVRGTNLSRTAPGTSLLGSQFYSGIEVYPTNPPTYLSNVATGAVRLVPPIYERDMSTLVLMSSALTFINSKGLNEDGSSFSHVFAERQDLALATELSPDLNNTVREYAGNKFGGVLNVSNGFSSKISLKWLADHGGGRYPINVLARDTELELKQEQALGILSYEGILGSTTIRGNWSENRSKSTSTSTFDSFEILNDHRFSFRSVGFDSDLMNSKLQLRGGIVSERIDLHTVGDYDRYESLAPEFGGVTRSERPTSLNYSNSHLYSVLKINDNVSAQLGFRTAPSNWENARSSYQSSIMFSDTERRQQLTFSGGRYFAVDIPMPGSESGLLDRLTEQVSVDYRFKAGEKLNLMFGVYAKDEISDRTSDVYGFDASLAWQINERGRVKARFTKASVKSTNATQTFPEPHSLDYLWSLTGEWVVGYGQITINYMSRSGRYFTPIEDSYEFQGQAYPIYSRRINQRQLGDFRRLDVAYGGPIRLPGDLQPVLFVGISNLLNRDNERIPAYYDDFSRSDMMHYAGRTLTCGLVFLWF